MDNELLQISQLIYNYLKKSSSKLSLYNRESNIRRELATRTLEIVNTVQDDNTMGVVFNNYNDGSVLITCSRCNGTLTNKGVKYCCNCGVQLNWNDVDIQEVSSYD